MSISIAQGNSSVSRSGARTPFRLGCRGLGLLIAIVGLLAACGPDEGEPVQPLVDQPTQRPLPTEPQVVVTDPPVVVTEPPIEPTAVPVVYYASCADARAAGAAPLRRGDPGYRPALDRDADGVACE